MNMERIAQWAFFIFVILAIAMGLTVGYMNWADDPNAAATEAYITLIMLILGVIVGLVSITAKEVMPFLIAAIALVVTGNAYVWGSLQVIHPLLKQWAIEIINFIVAFAAPAAIINAVKAVFAMTKEK
jgi:hypothetical protein